MKRKIISLGSLTALALGSGVAGASDLVDTARVITATPIVQHISEPHQECTTQTMVTPAQPQGNGIAGGIIGGLAGGLLGAQVGHGSGKTAATIVGAAGGAIVGNQIANAPQPATAQPVESCRTVESTHDVVTGYTVVYRYNGRDITTTLPYNPGSFVKIGIGVIDEGVAVNTPPRRHGDRLEVQPPPPPPGYYYR